MATLNAIFKLCADIQEVFKAQVAHDEVRYKAALERLLMELSRQIPLPPKPLHSIHCTFFRW